MIAMDTAAAHQYYSYLLRIWKVRADHETWRASLERVGSGERRSFATLPALFDYLQQVTQTPDDLQGRRANGEDQNEGS